jgi:hypothetical protein
LLRATSALLLIGGLTFSLRCTPNMIDVGEGEDGGGGAGDGGADMSLPLPKTTVLRITPVNEVMLVDLNQEPTKAFTATLVQPTGMTEDVTAKATFTLSNGTVGALSGATFRAAKMGTARVDFTTVTATYKDGESELQATANLTLVWLRTSGDQQDFFFTLPYQDPEQKKPLAFTTQIQSIDAFFAVDTTASMTDSINALKSSLQTTIIPGVKAAAVKDAWFGVGAVEDFPTSYTLNFMGTNQTITAGYAGWQGDKDDQPLILLSEMNANVTTAQNAVNSLLRGSAPRGNGMDVPEGQMEALYQIATGKGNVVAGVVNIPANNKGIGGVAFRKGALPVVTLITDAIFHTKGEPTRACSARDTLGNTIYGPAELAGGAAAAAHTRAETIAALNQICAKVVGVSTLRTTMPNIQTDPNGICNATDDLRQMAVGTGARVPPGVWDLAGRPTGCAAGKCCTGVNGASENPDNDGLCPLVFRIPQNGTGLGSQVTAGITQVARFSQFDVVTSVSGQAQGDKGEKLPAGKTTADFIKSVLPLDATAPPPPPAIPAPVIMGDKFVKVTPGSVVRFDVKARNDFLPALPMPQVFRAKIKVLAGGCADLDERDVLILVPPSAPVIG